MPQYTKNYKIPYPVDGDPIYQGAAQMRALAEKVDATMIGVSGKPGPQGATGPAGPQGDRGPEGPAGPAGPEGPRGATGAKGDTGDRGPAGETGPVGPPGPTGPRGATGAKGDTGPAGPKGEAGTGFTLKGSKSNKSELPTNAKAGDAYLVAGDVMVWSGSAWENVGQIQGPEGPEGPRGATGAKGDTGDRGPAGPQGATGPEGPEGPRGPQGDPGPRGPAGPQGETGAKGDTGDRGPAGATGPRGATGSRGPEGPAGPAGPEAPKYYGILRWSGNWYNPPRDQFTRLRANSNGRLYVYFDRGQVARQNGDDPCLVAPVDGLYLLSAKQTWGNGNAVKAMGLGGSTTDGMKDIALWQDVVNSSFGMVTTLVWLTQGTTLYPWTFNSSNTGMSPADRGVTSEYSMCLVSAR